MSGLSHVVIPIQKVLCVGCIVEVVCRTKCPYMIRAISEIKERMKYHKDTDLWEPLIPQTDEQMNILQDTIREVSERVYIERIKGGEQL